MNKMQSTLPPKPKYRVNYQLSKKRAAPRPKAEEELKGFEAFVASIDYDYENINREKVKAQEAAMKEIAQ